jgi:putative ABC transport system ATP-binding protein
MSPPATWTATCYRGCFEVLKRLNEDFHKTIVLATHDPHAASYAHVTGHLEKGMLLPA